MNEIKGTKSWWNGDPRVENWMVPVSVILDKEVDSKASRKLIYNIVYEQMRKAIDYYDGFTESLKLTESHEETEFYLNRFLSEDEKFRLITKGLKIGYHTSIKDLGAGTIVSFLKEV